MFALMIKWIKNPEMREQVCNTHTFDFEITLICNLPHQGRERLCFFRLFNARCKDGDVDSTGKCVVFSFPLVQSFDLYIGEDAAFRCDDIDDAEMTILSPTPIATDLMKNVGKWENRIFRVIQHGREYQGHIWLCTDYGLFFRPFSY